MLGQLAGDSLGSLVEFRGPDSILKQYPKGVRDLDDGGTFNTIAGQPTDDSEMALLLARMLVKRGDYDADTAFQEYRYWMSSEPFDCGFTISSALYGSPNRESQANGAMMRISPLGIFGAKKPLEKVADWAMQDAALTHPNPICQQANALFAKAVAHSIATGCEPNELYEAIVEWTTELAVDSALADVVLKAASEPPADYTRNQGWVLLAFQNALWQLLHAPDLETGVVDSVMRGGDTDTNAAICGALLGAVYGLDSVPERWVDKVLNCRPEKGRSGVFQPRPECFWPVDALELAENLLH